MKKISSLIVCLLTCLLTLMIATGCGRKSIVTLDAGEGAQIETSTIELTRGDEYTLPTPTRVGYNFLGWKNGDENISNKGAWHNKGDVTLTARWESKIYNVTLDTQGGYLENSTCKVVFGEAFTLPVPTKEGNEFVSWTYNDEVMQDGIWNLDLDGIELKAVWNPSITKITFDLSGGTFLNTTETTASVAYGTEYTFPHVYNGSHKTLKCWKNLATGQEFYIDALDKAWKVKDTEITLTAIWISDKHTVKVNHNGATEFDCELEQQVECETEFVLPTVAKEGFAFAGWYVGETKIDTATYKIVENVVFEAKWVQIKTLVKYNDGETIEILYGAPYTLKSVGEGYYGWRITTTKQYIPAEGVWNVELSSIELEPVANGDVCVVTFTGESVSISPAVYTKGQIVNLPIPQEAKSGYEFEGWTKKGSEIIISSGSAWADVGTLELVAKWKTKNFVITLDANGGSFKSDDASVRENIVLSFGESYDLSSDYTPYLASHDFVGWAYNEKLIAPVNPEGMLHNGLIILPKDEWNFDGVTNITLKAIYISHDTGFGPQV